MKTTIVTLALLFGFLSLFAEEKKIILNKATLNRDRRSITYDPVATHDGNLLHIYTEWLMENCQITVTDTNGQIVFTETTTLFPEQPYIFSITMTGEGTYRLEITQRESCYYGYFTSK